MKISPQDSKICPFLAITRAMDKYSNRVYTCLGEGCALAVEVLSNTGEKMWVCGIKLMAARTSDETC